MGLLFLSQGSYSQTTDTQPLRSSSVYLIPFHAPFGILEELPSYHITVGYNYKKNPQSLWSPNIFLTVGSAKTFIVTHYRREGYNLFLAPGVTYTPKKHLDTERFQVSGHLIMGYSNHTLSTLYYRSSDVKNNYGGLLVNGHFNTKITSRMYLNMFFGLGMKYEHSKGHGLPFDSHNSPFYEFKRNSFNPIVNMGLGLKFKL